MSFFTTTIIIGLLSAGTLFLRHDVSRTDEFVRYSSGRVEKVTVINGQDYYCPYTCRINHRHIVHEVEWQCEDADRCVHFVMTYGIPGNDKNMPIPPPLAEGRGNEGTIAEKPAPNR